MRVQCLVLDLFPQRVAPFDRGSFATISTTGCPDLSDTDDVDTDQQTGLLAGSDRLVLGMH